MKKVVLFAAAGLLATASIVGATVVSSKTETKVEKKEAKKVVKEKKDCSSYKRHCPFS